MYWCLRNNFPMFYNLYTAFTDIDIQQNSLDGLKLLLRDILEALHLLCRAEHLNEKADSTPSEVLAPYKESI